MLSFLSAVHNEEKHLPAMLDSLLLQSDPRWEVVLVDDGSVDRTAAILSEYASRDPRIRVIGTGVKVGKVQAFNSSFSKSRGAVICLSAGDDIHPHHAVRSRLRAFQEADPYEDRWAAFFKLKMFSADPRFNGLIFPRGQRGSRSGPSTTVTRPLASILFPIPTSLATEDIWLGEAAEDIADRVVEVDEVVTLYRIHEGNSNPRHKSFADMSAAMHVRSRAWTELLATPKFSLTESKRRQLEAKLSAEQQRYARHPLGVLRTDALPYIDRLAIASMAHPVLWSIRRRFFKFFTGRRGW